MKYVFLLFIASLILTSCEKGVTFDLDESSPKLVVEATIETNQPPIVILTKSQNFFDQITPDILVESFVRNAEVYVSNGTLTHKLKEYSIHIANGYNFYFYSIDSSNLSTAFIGQTNTQYSLRIVSEGKSLLQQPKFRLLQEDLILFFGNKLREVMIQIK